MNIIDPVLLVLLALFALRGYFKGLFRESFSLLGLLVGFMVAVRYDEPVAALWSEYWEFSLFAVRALTFVGLFFAIYFVFSLAGWLLHRSSKFLFLKTANRVGGIVLGMGKGAAILALIVFYLLSFPFIPQRARQRIDESYLVPPLQYIAQGIIQFGKANILPQEESMVRDGEGVGYF